MENEEIIVETTKAESNEVELSEGMRNTDNNVIENGAPTESIEDKMRSDGLGDDDIREELQKELIEDPINLRFVDRKRLKSVTAKVDK